MTPDQFRECLDLIGWSQRGLAAKLDIHEMRPRRWATGKYPVPPNVAAWLRQLAAVHGKHPAPQDWTPEYNPRKTQNKSCMETRDAS